MPAQHFGERGEWWVVGQMALFGAAMVAPGKGRTWSPGWRRAARIVGAPLVLAGVGLARAAARDLGENLTPLPHPKEDATLVRDDVYGVVRHPIYSSAILLTLAAAFLAFFDAKARREEAWLTEKFPSYPAYRRSVKKLIPFVY